jgi:ubiquitin-protein ligase
MVASPRLRRLMADSNLMRTEFAGHPQISVEPLGWDPPEQYRVTYRLTGVMTDPATGQPVTSGEHRVVLTLPAAYPRDKPYCTTETPVFHPNFGQNAGDEICIGDYWTPAQSLADIVVKVGEMIQFQEFNVKSPLNALAARWAAENQTIFPIGTVELFQAEPDISLDLGVPDAPSSTPSDVHDGADAQTDADADGATQADVGATSDADDEPAARIEMSMDDLDDAGDSPRSS